MDRSRKPAQSAEELYRLQVLADARLLDTAPEPAFDDLTSIARRITGAPIALISLVDAERQWFKARQGLDASETSRDVAFCSHAIESGRCMIVEDARRDPRFCNNPLVTGEPKSYFTRANRYSSKVPPWAKPRPSVRYA